MKNKPSYFLFWKENWKELLIIIGLLYTIVGAIIKIPYLTNLWLKIEERGKKYKVEKKTGVYYKTQTGKFKEVINYFNPYNEYVVFTLLYSFVPWTILVLNLLLSSI